MQKGRKPGKRKLPRLKRHVIVETDAKNLKKLDSFCRVMHDVAKDMGIEAYIDETGYLIGADY